MAFSKRTNWHRQPNKLSELLESLRGNGKTIFDLTISNPTECGIEYPEKEILSALSAPPVLHYEPNPRGLLSARKAVCEYYRGKSIAVNSTNIFLTASTSEAYSVIFKLLCNAGENILVSKPSYPLFDYLGQLNDVMLRYYYLRYDHEWRIDIDSIKTAINKNTKAIVLINPHNPTGMFLAQKEYREIAVLAKKNNIALIVDEVFVDYTFENDTKRILSAASETNVLTFTLNGISKMAGLPQMKLSWLVMGGESLVVREATERLEIICDTFLSVNTPAQIALPQLMIAGEVIQRKILDRIRSNYSILQTKTLNTPCSLLFAEGGWYGIIRVPRIKSDEAWALQLLETKGIYLFPGYFFDFEDEGHLVVSLLVESFVFQKAVREIVEFFDVV